MPIPLGLSPDLAAFLQEVDDRVRAVETPMGFSPAYLTVSTNLSTINAAQSGGRWVILTDLKTAAYSDGSHWYNLSSGAQIV